MCAITNNILVICNETRKLGNLQNLLEYLDDELNMVYSTGDIEQAMLLLDKDTSCAIIDWNLENDPSHEAPRLLLQNIKTHNQSIPVFLMLSPDRNDTFDKDILAAIDGFFWHDDNMNEIGSEIEKSIERGKIALYNRERKDEGGPLHDLSLVKPHQPDFAPAI